MKTHHDLKVWNLSLDFVTKIYRLSQDFPKSELYGLTNQIRRSAISIPSNIAEGAARTSVKEFNNFLSISLGSISELETQLLIAKNLDYISDDQMTLYLQELTEIRKMTIGLKKSLKI